MLERKEPHHAAQEEFRRALTGEFEPVRASGPANASQPSANRAPSAGSDAAPAVPADAAKRAVAARAERMRSQKKRRRRFAAVGILVLVLVAAGVAAFALAQPHEVAEQGESFFDENAQSGQAPNKTPAELQAELNRVVEEGMFNISIASVIEFATPDASGKAYIENVPSNPYDMTVEITLSDSGEKVYQSKGIAPGNFIEDIVLDVPLEPGVHEAVATFAAYDRDTHAQKGKAAAEVALIVGKGGDASG